MWFLFCKVDEECSKKILEDEFVERMVDFCLFFFIWWRLYLIWLFIVKNWFSGKFVICVKIGGVFMVKEEKLFEGRVYDWFWELKKCIE